MTTLSSFAATMNCGVLARNEFYEGTVKETSEILTVTMDRPMWIIAESKP
jgi:hypothetical protein